MNPIGYVLSSEEHGPQELVRNARLAEEAGFTGVLISDHYHPWTNKQGHSPFVWSVIGALACATREIEIGTGVTCPTMRLHPAIIAQAAATSSTLLPGRFFLGVGTGENLNEHVTGAKWPSPAVRLEMLEEAIGAIRQLWEGGFQTHHGKHFTVEQARLYDLPEEPPPIIVAAAGQKATQIAARAGDGLLGTSADRDQLDTFAETEGNKPKYAKTIVCWDESEAKARRTVHEWWPVAMLGDSMTELPTPTFIEDATKLVREEDVAENVLCSPDPAEHVSRIQAYLDAGYDRVFIHQVGPRQEDFIRMCEREIVPHFAGK